MHIEAQLENVEKFMGMNEVKGMLKKLFFKPPNEVLSWFGQWHWARLLDGSEPQSPAGLLHSPALPLTIVLFLVWGSLPLAPGTPLHIHDITAQTSILIYISVSTSDDRFSIAFRSGRRAVFSCYFRSYINLEVHFLCKVLWCLQGLN